MSHMANKETLANQDVPHERARCVPCTVIGLLFLGMIAGFVLLLSYYLFS